MAAVLPVGATHLLIHFGVESCAYVWWRMGYVPNRYRGRQLQSATLVCGRTRARGNSISRDFPACAMSRVAAGPFWEQVRAHFISAVRDPDRVVREVETATLTESTRYAVEIA